MAARSILRFVRKEGNRQLKIDSIIGRARTFVAELRERRIKTRNVGI